MEISHTLQGFSMPRHRHADSLWVRSVSKLMVVLAILVTVGCTAVGNGGRTVIQAKTDDRTLASRFPFLLTPSASGIDRTQIIERSELSALPPTSTTSREVEFNKFRSYMRAKYGDENFAGAMLDVTFRDLGRVPVFDPQVNTFLRQEIIKIQNDKELKPEERNARIQELRAVVLNAPAAANSTTFNRISGKGEEIFYYYARLQIDFTADLLSNSTLDRFSQLIMFIELPEEAHAKNVRFLDFAPKPSDIVDYTRGQLKQSAQLQAKATAGRTAGSNKTTESGDSSKTSESGLSLGADVSFTATEEYTRQLQDALEKRTAGIMANGRALLVQFRSVRHLRIGGTYSFDVMLEIPSTVQQLPGTNGKFYALDPVVNVIKPKIALIGVVRHVYDRGKTGFFNIVPEIENDDVYEQVVLKSISDEELWSFNGEPWIRPYEFEPAKMFTVHVVTNHELASFVVTDITDAREPKIINRGKGEDVKLKIETDDLQNNMLVQIDFFPIVHFVDKGAVSIVNPSLTTSKFHIDANSAGTKSFVVKYQ